MVNSKEFAQRLHIILEYYDLSASAFAKRIGVQPSGISHLLSGRNKPSLDFIMKVVEQFPEVDLYWLLNGKGSFPSEKAAPLPYREELKPPIKDSKNVHQIIICYSDGTFESYSPSR